MLTMSQKGTCAKRLSFLFKQTTTAIQTSGFSFYKSTEILFQNLCDFLAVSSISGRLCFGLLIQKIVTICFIVKTPF